MPVPYHTPKGGDRQIEDAILALDEEIQDELDFIETMDEPQDI